MSAILLVRHGQASYGSSDYDQLSPLGIAQAEQLGQVLRGEIVPATVTTGRLTRQRDTARSLVSGAAWEVPIAADESWNEFGFAGLEGAGNGSFGGMDSRSFQDVLELAMAAWFAGEDGAGFSEDFHEFDRRTQSALAGLSDRGPGSHVVVTSAGVISWIVARLLGGGVEQWIALNRVCINSSITKVVDGRRGLSLISFNEHRHLSLENVTYR